MKIVIAGAGPAGLTAAAESLEKLPGCSVTVYESSPYIGGISRTHVHNGNRIDIGGHRFFSKSDRVTEFWERYLPQQGAPAVDDEMLGREVPVGSSGPDPKQSDRVMLTRPRVSRIFYLRRFFDYPISLKWSTFANLGLGRTVKAGWGYMKARLAKRQENSLEDFYINRFGQPLYSMFFEDYTTKVWGKHPSGLGADWGAQRVKGLSVSKILANMLTKPFRRSNAQVETSLIERFLYPKFGPGQLWETVAEDVVEKGGNVEANQTVTAVNVDPSTRRIVSVTVSDGVGGATTDTPVDAFFSSMPVKDLVAAIGGIEVPADVAQAAGQLPYRDFITVGLLVKDLKITNRTKRPTVGDRVPDTWIYIQERDVRIGRLQIFNNWSPYMVADFEDTMWIGLEYFCNEGDEMWNMPDAEFIARAIDEMVKIDILESKDAVLDSVEIRVKKAYPAYYGSYSDFAKIRSFLDTIPNLYCIGRNGQHRYNNMDHSMLTAMEAVDALAHGRADKSALWSVNTEEEYHESH